MSSIVRPRKHARHAKPSKAAPAMAAAGLSASFVAGDIAAFSSSASAATADDFRRLRLCESGGNYGINTGNGYYGAYQFALGTWRGLGYSGRPDLASPATQDAAARELQARSGWGQWPACSRKLGLGSSSAGDGVANAPAAPSRLEALRASRSRTALATKARAPRVRVAVAPMTPPPFLHSNLSVADQDRFRIGVHMWQDRMAKRGWPITVDGYFGPQSSAIAKKFAAEKGLQLGSALPGEVNRAVWDAAWSLPVS